MSNDKKQKIRTELGAKLKKLREGAKLTQAQLAEKAEISVNYYAMVERGEENISYDNLQKLMKALDIETLNITSESSR